MVFIAVARRRKLAPTTTKVSKDRRLMIRYFITTPAISGSRQIVFHGGAKSARTMVSWSPRAGRRDISSVTMRLTSSTWASVKVRSSRRVTVKRFTKSLG